MPIRIFAHMTGDLAKAAQEAREIEALGFDGAVSHETSHDPFFPLVLAAANTTRLHLMTDVAIAFARSPMTLANVAHDLNAFSGGRFTLGLGSQIKPHITRRFSMPWSHPAARMRELVQAIRAIFATWYDGAPLHFEGQFYTHTLMTPAFTPSDITHGKPAIGIAAVGPLMTETAGAVADRLFVHPFTTETYLRRHTLPHLKAGLESANRPADACQLLYDPMIVTGTTAETFARSRKAMADRIAFYASTPAYRPVLDAHGWGELQPELQAMTKAGRWSELGNLVTDDMLSTFAVVGEVKDIAPQIWARYGDLVTDFGLSSSAIDRATLAQIAADLRTRAGS
ncbi:MAG TPA: TIGR03617 family F420-dependent LLM class oxidoreductase [Vineibacter sp.]|nr:TIGR03617 family F420-dependent LLM class oxidoreductase [Vineibacter sp.]